MQMKFIKKNKLALYIPTVFICLSITFPAWAFGGTESWAIRFLFGLSLTTLFSVFISKSFSLSLPAFQPFSFSLPPFQLFSISAFLIFVCIQTLNPSHTYSELFHSLEPRQYIVWLPATVSRQASVRALLLLLSYFAVYTSVRSLSKDKMLYTILAAIIVSSVCMSVLALLQGGSNEQGDLVGMFLNDNNFAVYINLVLPVVLGSAKTIHRRSKHNHSRSNPAVLIYFCAGILAAAVLYTGSRAGAVITILILAAWVSFELYDSRQAGIKTKQIFLYVVLAMIPTAVMLYLSGIGGWYHQLADPVTRLSDVVSTRFVVITDTWNMFLDRIACGVGAGAFHAAFPYYQNPDVIGFYRNAHNDWIQWLAELGVVGYGLGIVAVVTTFKKSPQKKIHLPRHIARGITIGLAGVCLHALLDFPFRIPAITVIVAAWIGILTKRSFRHEKRTHRT
jgi:uncharacterized membrane protein